MIKLSLKKIKKTSFQNKHDNKLIQMKFSYEHMNSLYVDGQVYRLSSEMGVRIYVCLQVPQLAY